MSKSTSKDLSLELLHVVHNTLVSTIEIVQDHLLSISNDPDAKSRAGRMVVFTRHLVTLEAQKAQVLQYIRETE